MLFQDLKDLIDAVVLRADQERGVPHHQKSAGRGKPRHKVSFRRERGLPAIARIMYGKYPEFLKSFENTAELFNSKVEELYRKSAEGKAFVIEPSSEVTVTRFEGDMDKLGDLYHLGYDDALAKLDDLKKYLDQGR